MRQIKGTLYKKALLLEYLTIAWNIFEGMMAMILGLLAGSVSLFAYGLESAIEVFASAVTVWQLKGATQKREGQALKLIGIAYIGVSLYICIDALSSLLHGHRPHASYWGIVFLLVTVFVMVTLGVLKLSVGKHMRNPVIQADAKFTLIDAVLSGTVLIGLLLNAFFGWWWTDEALALFLAGAAFREGMKELL